MGRRAAPSTLRVIAWYGDLAPRSPTASPSTIVTGMIPPAVLDRKTSSACLSPSAGTARVSMGMPCSCGELDHGLAGDTFQDPAVRGGDGAVVYGEYVEAGSFDDVVLGIDQDHRLPTALVGFEKPDLEVEPVVVLDGRVDRLWCYALPIGR